MTHNPILGTQTIGRADSLDLRLNTKMVVYCNNVFLKILDPGSGLSLRERLRGGLIGYIVDCAPHDAVWQTSLQAKDEADSFPVIVKLKYRVEDARRMVEDQVKDTETLVANALQPILRKETRQYQLHQHKNVESRMEEIISDMPTFQRLGLSLMSVDVEMNFGDHDRERIRQLEELKRAMEFSQQTEHDARLPTSEDAYEFQTHVTLDYRVADPYEIPTATLEQAEERLWRKVRAALRIKSREYSVGQIHTAEKELQKIIKESEFSGHGITIEAGQIELSLDERARSRAEKLAELRDEKTIADEQAALDEIRKKRALDSKKLAIDFYAPYIERGQWRLLAISLAENEMDAEQVLRYLDEKQKEKLGLQLKLLESLKDKDLIPEKEGTKVVVDVLREIYSQVSTEAGLQELSAPEEKKALEDRTAENRKVTTNTADKELSEVEQEIKKEGTILDYEEIDSKSSVDENRDEAETDEIEDHETEDDEPPENREDIS